MADRLTSLTLQHALRLSEQKEHARALEVIGALEVTLDDTPDELRSTRKYIEDQLLAELHRRFPDRSACFVPLCTSDELRSKALKAKDAYVWTHCDGATTLDDLVAVTESELETLLSLSKLVGLGLVRKAARA